MKLLSSALFAACVVLTGCSPPKQEGGEAGLRVFVSIPPQAYFVERIAGDRVSVQVIAASNANPYTCQPDSKQMSAAQKAGLYIATGVPVEEKVLAAIRMSKTQTGSKTPEIISAHKVEKLLPIIPHDNCEGLASLVISGHEGHGHGADCDHGCAFGHGKKGPVCAVNGKDPHTWLSPQLAILQIHRIKGALIAADPEGKQIYEMNSEALVDELLNLWERFDLAFSNDKCKAILVSHPAWQYLLFHSGTEQILLPEKEKMADAIEKAKAAGVKLIFLSPRSDAAIADEVAKAIDGVVIPADPFARDYMANLTAIAEAIEKVLPRQDVYTED